MTGVESGMRHGLRSLGMKNRQKGENKKSSYFIFGKYYLGIQIKTKVTLPRASSNNASLPTKYFIRNNELGKYYRRLCKWAQWLLPTSEICGLSPTIGNFKRNLIAVDCKEKMEIKKK